MKRILIMAAAVFSVVACNQVKDVTLISGTVDSDVIDEVNVILSEAQIDTLVPVTDRKFTLEVPTDPAVVGVIEAADFAVQFIPDGTVLDVVLGEDSQVKSRSRNSVQNRFTEYIDKSMAIQNDFQAVVTEISNDGSLTEEQKETAIDSNYNSAIDSFVEYNLETISRNRDNFIGIMALNNAAMMMDDSQVDSVINTLSDRLKADESVQKLQAAINAKLNTAEGKMFTDFTVEDSDGRTVSFSDYVGKGSYVLVDFWASWCGPCRAEIPNIKAVYDKYASEGLKVLSIAVWDHPEDTKASAKELGIVWDQIINAQTIPTELYGIQGIPHIILFGPDGTILKRGLRGDEIGAEIGRYLE